MLKDEVKKYYLMGYNCSESLLRAGNDYYHLNLHDHDMKMVAAFGAGMQCGDICGALVGSACIISSKYIEIKAHDQPVELRQITNKLNIAFKKRMGSKLCAEIKPNFFKPEIRCQDTVCVAVDVLESVINEWDKQHEK